MRSNILAGLTLAAALAGGSGLGPRAGAQPVTVIAADATWRFLQPTAPILDYSGWETPGYDDGGWPVGEATFAWELTPSTLAFLQNNAPTNTLLEPPEGRTDYFRTRFDWVGETAGAVLVWSNLVDDGAVFYLNGVEQERLRLADGMPAWWGVFATETTPGGDVAAWEVLTLGSSNLVTGENVVAVSVHQQSANSSDVVFGMTLTALRPFSPVLADPGEPVDAVVQVSRRHELTVIADGFPAPTYQWFFGPEGGGGFAALLGATGSNHVIASIQTADAGRYYCRVSNSAGVVYSRTNTLTVLPDADPPMLIAAVRDPNLTNIIVTFSEPMGSSALTVGNYLVCVNESFEGCLGIWATAPEGDGLWFVPGSDDTQVLLATDLPESAEQPYQLLVVDVADRAGNVVPGILSFPVAMPRLGEFQEGRGGYGGTVDTYLRQDQPDLAFGGDTRVLVDSLSPVSHGLLRFESVVGPGAGQVPYGAVIESATLSLHTVNPTRLNASIRLHRMLQPWDPDDTWNTPWGGGLRADGVVAAVAMAAELNPATNSQTLRVDVTTSVQAWLDGQLNHGWFFTNTVDDGYQFAASEHPALEIRPRLAVVYQEGPPAPAEIVVVPPTNRVVVLQGALLDLRYGVRGPGLAFQWFRDGMAVPGETNAILQWTATAGDAGEYVLRVSNDFPSTTNSPGITVEVIADTTPPMLVGASATGATNLTQVVLEFSEPVAAGPATVAGNYSLVPAAAITGATLLDANRVRLGVQASFGQRYTVVVGSGVTDLWGNPVAGPGNQREVATSLVLVEWNDSWKYDAGNFDWLAAGYAAADFDDAAWPAGPGLLGTEAAGGVPLGTMVNATGYTSYYRRQVTWPFPPGSIDPAVELVFRHVIDDGVVWHVNGMEAFRFKMPAGFVLHSTLSDNTGFADEAELGTNRVSPGLLAAGTNVLAADLHPVSATSSDNVFGLQLLAVLPTITPVRIVSLPSSFEVALTQGQAFRLEVGVAGFQPQFQWFHDGAPIPGATTHFLEVSRALAADAGDYFLQATNINPSATNSPVFTVTVLPDPSPPEWYSAMREPELTNIVVRVSKELVAGSAGDPGNYLLFASDDPGRTLPVVNVVWERERLTLTVQTATPVPPGYTLLISNVTDLAGNNLTPATRAVATPQAFLEGWSGYTGTMDAHVVREEPDTAFGDADRLLVDGLSPVSHGLLRFENLFGPGGVAAGAVIHSATLRLQAENVGDNVAMHRMLAPWDESSTWNRLGGMGVLANNVIAVAAPDALIPAGSLGSIHVDVTASVQAWATGAVNYGWGLINLATDGFQCASSEAGEVLWRPALLVEWSDPGGCVPVSIIAEPPAAQAAVEGQAVAIPVAVFGSGFSVQWQKDGVDLPGATHAALTLPAVVPGDAGVYRAVVTNACPSAAVSRESVLTVEPDLIGPALVGALARGPAIGEMLTRVVLTFDEALAVGTAEVAANYAVYGPGAEPVGIAGAALIQANAVGLALAEPLQFGSNYTVVVAPAVTDAAVARNPVLPGSALVEQEIVLLGYTNLWRYDEGRTAADNYDGAEPAWYSAAFSDLDWAVGPGIFAWETSAPVLEALPGPVGTELSVSNRPIYFRNNFDWPFGLPPDNAGFEARFAVDDGLVCYLNGAEAFRVKMGEGEVTYATLASVGGETTISVTQIPPAKILSVNNIACSLHPVSVTSSDAIFGLELVARYPVEPVAPHLTIMESAPGQVTVQWSPDFGRLQSAPSPAGPWSDVADRPNPTSVEAGGPARFYRVRP